VTSVHVLPCGTSILRNLRAGVPGCRMTPVQVDEMQRWASDELIRDQPASQWRQTFARDVGPHLRLLQAAQDPVRLSAETASLTRYATRVGDGLQPQDLVVLLASDTAEGMLAALLVAASLNRGVEEHPAPARDAAAHGELLTAGQPGRAPVHVVRIPKLLPDSTTNFTAAMTDLAGAMLWAGRRRRRPEQRLVVHLSGGYKATLPYLLVMCEYLKALQPPVEAFCLHEGDPGSPVLPDLVEIFLRSVDLDADLALLNEAAQGNIPNDPRLGGFAYREVRGRAVLTGVGHVLTAFQVFLGNGP
jgi:hypothetical protein